MNKRRRYKAKAKRKAKRLARHTTTITIVMDATALKFFGTDPEADEPEYRPVAQLDSAANS